MPRYVPLPRSPTAHLLRPTGHPRGNPIRYASRGLHAARTRALAHLEITAADEQINLFALTLLAATAVLGLWLGDLHGVTEPAVLRWGTVHRLSGVFAALSVVLVNSLTVTYFIGTGRWCRRRSRRRRR